MKFILSGLAIVSQLFFVNLSLNAQVLTDEQVTRKVQCKQIIPDMNKVNLEDCTYGRFELSKYRVCGNANVHESYLKDCVKGTFSIERYTECRTFSYPTNSDFATCLKTNTTFEYRKNCAKFNRNFLGASNLKDIDCNDESIKLDSLKVCSEKLDKYKLTVSNYYDGYEIYLNKTGNFFESETVFNSWIDTDEYTNFLKNCYSIDRQIFNTCFDYFDESKSRDLTRVSRCMKFQATAEGIKKCETILNNPKNKEEIVDCLKEFYTAKIARETPEKLNEVLHPKESEASKTARILNDDNRSNNKDVSKTPSKAKSNKATTKNH